MNPQIAVKLKTTKQGQRENVTTTYIRDRVEEESGDKGPSFFKYISTKKKNRYTF